MSKGRTYESPHEKLREEFEILMGQNATVMRETPAYTVAQLFQLADTYRRKHGIDLAEVREESNGVHLLKLEGGEMDDVMAAIGLDDLEQVSDLDVVMLDDRTVWEGEF